ncbi:DUF1972 domain-containing protein [Arthrobacter zhangbolii]|uniref:DUF1972 domain-containing protein n=1 Tax=Arthrobacter zhangbolii TaxID=2886936 RepID=A0A9X1M9Y3_9MICC|nr:DUF1972 domain-containing protein [Arthrobacter zhangbolii]MCC3272959.1 DUF1972 domain-containing protein [Arthrobacter zhangbolii]UON93008.1 DUF1972 domain-containing protein [Arthrobacter zhangbolii]
MRVPVADSRLRIALVGTRGVPARYGGFETCVEEVGKRLVERGHQVTVYCRIDARTDTSVREYLGMDLVHLPALHKRSLETLSHTGLSAAHLLGHRPDAAIVFNAANSPWLPLLRGAGIPVATHVDGLEWKRAKWGPVGQRYYRYAEALAVRYSDALIADAGGIQQYYREEFDAEAVLITYGAPILGDAGDHRLAEVDLTANQYHLVVARMEPENHVHTIVEGYLRSGSVLPLVVVGSAPYAEQYTGSIRRMADARVRFLGGVWDQELLDQLYANSRVYWHGHSVGGTNPSLLRAMGAGAAVNAFDVVFNREVLRSAGRFFTNPEDVSKLALAAEISPQDAAERGRTSLQEAARYDWDDVTYKYELLARGLAAGEFRCPGSARRRRPGLQEARLTGASR